MCDVRKGRAATEDATHLDHAAPLTADTWYIQRLDDKLSLAKGNLSSKM